MDLKFIRNGKKVLKMNGSQIKYLFLFLD